LKNLWILKDEPTITAPNGKVLLGASMTRSKPKRYKKGINEFAVLSDEEFKNYYLNPYLDVSKFVETKSMIENDQKPRWKGRSL